VMGVVVSCRCRLCPAGARPGSTLCARCAVRRGAGARRGTLCSRCSRAEDLWRGPVREWLCADCAIESGVRIELSVVPNDYLHNLEREAL